MLPLPGRSWSHDRLVLRKRCTVVGWRPLAERGFPRCLSGEVLPSCQAATFACLWRVHAQTHTQLRSVCFMSLPFNVWKHTVGFWMLSGIRCILEHYGQFFSSASLVVPKCIAVIVLLDIVGRWLQQQPPLWVPRWIESKYCRTHLQHRNRPSWQTFAFNRTGLNVFRRDIIQMLVLAIRSFKGWKELWWSRTNNGWNWQDSSLKLISCKPSYSLDIYLYIYIQIYI